MSMRTSHKVQDNLQARILRDHPDAPPTVALSEARYRVGQHALKLRKLGGSLKAVGSAVGYSPTYLHSVVLPVAEQRAALGSEFVPPLDAWLATDAAHASAPEPEEAFTFRPDESANNDAIDRMKRAMDDHTQILPEGTMFRATNGTLLTVPVGMTMIVRDPKPRVWHLIQDGNELSLVDPPVPAAPESYVPTDADRALYASIQDRSPLLGAAVRMLQLAAGIEATGDVDDETMSVVAGLAAWQGRSRPLLDDVERFMAARRGA